MIPGCRRKVVDYHRIDLAYHKVLFCRYFVRSILLQVIDRYRKISTVPLIIDRVIDREGILRFAGLSSP
jgi:hypothetical protein